MFPTLEVRLSDLHGRDIDKPGHAVCSQSTVAALVTASGFVSSDSEHCIIIGLVDNLVHAIKAGLPFLRYSFHLQTCH